MKVWVDCREDRRILSLLSKLGVEAEVRELPTDYIVSGEHGMVAVEAKTDNDFVSSLTSGRLWGQLETLSALREDGYHAFLLVRGSFYRVLRWRRIPLEAVMGAIASVAMDWGVHTVVVPNMHLQASFLSSLARRVGRPVEGRVYSLRHKAGGMTMDERARFVVEGLPGVSGELADRLLRHFGSIRGLVEGMDRLEEVRGIGPLKARKIREVITHTYGTEG